MKDIIIATMDVENEKKKQHQKDPSTLERN